MAYKCYMCGGKMKPAEDNKDSYLWVCSKCDTIGTLSGGEMDFDINFEDDELDYSSVYGNMADIPEGCRACGSSFYPDCRTWCNLIDE